MCEIFRKTGTETCGFPPTGELSFFDPETLKSEYFESEPGGLSSGNIRKTLRDREGRLWAATAEGVNRFEPKTGRFTHFLKENSGLSHNDVLSVFEDSSGQIWATTVQGLNKFLPETQTFKVYQKGDYPMESSVMFKICEDKKGKLWIGSYGGLNYFDPQKETFEVYKSNKTDSKSLYDDRVRDILISDDGMLWVGTNGGGLSVFDPKTQIFEHFRHHPDKPTSLSANDVNCVIRDKKNNLWVGTENGLNLYDSLNGTFKHFRNERGKPRSLSHNSVTKIFADRDGNVWVATYDGLNLYNPESRDFTVIRKKDKDSNSLIHNQLWTITQDSKGILWLGTFSGLSAYDHRKKTFLNFFHDKSNEKSLSHSEVWCILEDRHGDLWVGTRRGLNKYNYETKDFELFRDKSGISDMLSNKLIMNIYSDKNGNLWIGGTGGLIFYDYEKQEARHFAKEVGSSNSEIYGILEDEKGFIWLSTNEGLDRLDPKTARYVSYNHRDGLQDNEFNQGAYFKDKVGKMYFGGVNGFNVFSPDSIKENTHLPAVVLTDFLLFNKTVKVSDTTVLKKSLAYSEEIVLDHDDQIFAIAFSALNYRQAEKNKFAYKLEPLDKDWIYTGYKDRKATFTNIPPGTYTFRVKASNDDAYWNEAGTSLKITILPPWWLSWQMKMIYWILGIGLPLAAYYIREDLFKRQKAKLEYVVRKRTEKVELQSQKLLQNNEKLNSALRLVNEQKTEIEKWKDDTQASINYAARIQEAVLPLKEGISRALPESFVFLRPKDVVSGDFYWFNETDNKLILTVADCTGHGVPGAFMSMLGSQALTEIAGRGTTGRPGEILSKLDLHIRSSLKQKETGSRDGMDVSLTVIDRENRKIEFAGAKNSLLCVQNSEMKVVKGSKLSIGGEQYKKDRYYETHEIDISEPIVFYLFTDGFQDQFGGPNNKKFMIKHFRNLLLEIHKEPMSVQQQILEETIENWMGEIDEKQTDDICVLGVRI